MPRSIESVKTDHEKRGCESADQDDWQYSKHLSSLVGDFVVYVDASRLPGAIQLLEFLLLLMGQETVKPCLYVSALDEQFGQNSGLCSR